MRKKIISIAAAIVAFMAINASAQNTTNNCNNKCTKSESCKKSDDKCKKGDRQCANPFEGLNLTDSQQKAIKELRKDCCKKDSTCKAAKKEAQKAAKAESMKKRREDRAKYLADIKKILTPQQYEQFLENHFINSPRQHGKKHMKMEHRQGKKGNAKSRK